MVCSEEVVGGWGCYLITPSLGIREDLDMHLGIRSLDFEGMAWCIKTGRKNGFDD